MNWNELAGRTLDKVRKTRVQVHNVTNHVAMNYIAMALLAAGATPVMAHAHEEVEELASLAGAVALNIGTPEPAWVTAMKLAGKAANRKGIPVVFDPAGAGTSLYRTSTTRQLLWDLRTAVVRGNLSEISSLSQDDTTIDGLSNQTDATVIGPHVRNLARQFDTVLAVTGHTDYVSDGDRLLAIDGGHPLMSRVSGAGSAATALIAAFAAVESDPVVATVGALSYLKCAGQRAGELAAAPGSYQIALLDALYTLLASDLTSARISELVR